MNRTPAYLALADGTTFPGFAWGHPGVATGEVVFTTGMTGYQEVLSDPSYTGQLVTMTSPHIGNTGVNLQDAESVDGRPQLGGFIVRDPSLTTSSFRANEDLNGYLNRQKVVAIGGIDTRTLTRHLRDKGSQNGAIGTGSPDDLVDLARQTPSMDGLDLVRQVTPKQAYEFTEGRGEWGSSFRTISAANGPASFNPTPRYRVVAMDFGAKRNIFRCLVDVGCDLVAVPATTSAEALLAYNPEGVFLSSGPGDPAALGYAIDAIKGVLGKVPVFGICLGHQLLARALGGSTYKLKFGHRGLNQPVKDLKTGRVEITTQNHGFVVDLDSLAGVAESTHLHLNDGTSEGLIARDLDAFSVQYHPEAAAGPHDALYLFERFTRAMRARRKK